MERMHELQEARFKIELIEATYEELQKDLTRARNDINTWKEKAMVAMVQAKSFDVMMELIKQEPALQEQFDGLLVSMKLLCPDVESRMRTIPSGVSLP